MKNENSGKMYFGLLAGIIYLIFGILQVLNGFGISMDFMEMLMIPDDVFGGFVLLVISGVFLMGFKELKTGSGESVAFIYFGIVMSLIFVVIYLAIMAANALGWYGLGMEDLEGWTPLDDLKPILYLGFIGFIGFLAWRNKFSLRGLSKAGT